MTKPRYPHPGCVAWSQVYGEADGGVAASAWYVNSNNGNVNNNHRNNSGFGLAARRVGEFQGEQAGVTFKALYHAWRRARRKKVPSHNQLQFDRQWIDGLLQLEGDIAAGRWVPRPSTCFIATRPKAREIHAPDFGDRVVHHWLVPQLEAIYEPTFIHDSYANRRGKGTHAAVQRAEAFARQVHSGECGGWYLQLDIHNFFNSIHRPTLWGMLKRRLRRAGLSDQPLRVTHALLRRDPLAAGVRVRATAEEVDQVPVHKRLASARPGCGLPIGNLSSQFFANVYLDVLDKFAKHELKAKRYLRYVDDFVLFHHDRAQLQLWQDQIERFLGEKLRLSLKPDIRLRRLTDGLDFLGYVIHPTHTLVRRRAVAHATEAFADWERGHVRGNIITATSTELRRIRNQAASFDGHFRHANSHRLRAGMHKRFPWLGELA